MDIERKIVMQIIIRKDISHHDNSLVQKGTSEMKCINLAKVLLR